MGKVTCPTQNSTCPGQLDETFFLLFIIIIALCKGVCFFVVFLRSRKHAFLDLLLNEQPYAAESSCSQVVGC